MSRAPWALLLLPCVSRAQGPIDTRNGRAPSLAFLRLDPRGDLLGQGERTFSLDLLSANNLDFKRAAGLMEDQETERLGLRYAWGVARGEWGLEVPLLLRGGGLLDPLIRGFHEAIGIYQRGSLYQSVETLPGSGSFGSASGLGDASGSYSRALGRQALASFALKLPTGDAGGLLGSGGIDLAASLFERWRLGARLDLFGQLGGVYQGRPTRLVGARRLVDQESLSLRYRKNARDAWILQWQSEPSALVVGVPEVDGPHRLLTLGYARSVGPRETLQIYVSENGDFLNFKAPWLVDVAPDFSLGINVVRRW